MIEPYYEQDGITIYNADCEQVLPQLGRFDLLLTDPPYGLKRFNSGARTRVCKDSEGRDGLITWDIRPSDNLLLALLDISEFGVIWGANNYNLPPSEAFLVWDKQQTVDNFASAELAFANLPVTAKVFRYSFKQHISEGKHHPTQKPLPLMRWCLSFAPNAKTILDPFMGSGTTLLAAKLEGRQAVGIEISRDYCDVAIKRLQQKVLF